MSLCNFAHSEECSENNHQIYEGICKREDYYAAKLPFSFMNIIGTFELLEVYEVDDQKGTIDCHIGVLLSWVDPNIIWTDNNRSQVTIDPEWGLKNLWHPDFTIKRIMLFENIQVLAPQAGMYMIHEQGSENTTVFYKFYAKVKLACTMYFDKYPYDTQKCYFQMYSQSYDYTEIHVDSAYWEESKYVEKVTNYRVEVQSLDHYNHAHVVTYGENENEIVHNAGGLTILLIRHSRTFIMKYYMPCGAVVITSWVSFLIPPDIIPGRIGLLVTLFLVGMTIFSSILSNTPQSEGLTALSTFALATIFFTASAIFEYAFLLFIRRRLFIKDNFYKNKSEKTTEKFQSVFNILNMDLFCYKVDMLSLIMFCVCYIAFLIYINV